MDPAFKAFPTSHFPQYLNPHSGKRQLFMGWGSTQGIDIVEKPDQNNFEIVLQKRHHVDKWNQLHAKSVSLPMLPFNKYPADIPEPCSQVLEERKQALVKACRRLKTCKSKVKIYKREAQVKKHLGILRKQIDNSCDAISASSDSEAQYAKKDNKQRDPDYQINLSDLDSSSDEDLAALEVEKTIQMNFTDFVKKSPGVFETDWRSLEANSSYSGGCLSCQKTSANQGQIFSVRGPSMNQLYTIPYLISEHMLGVQTEKAYTTTLDSPIYQIDSTSVYGEVFVGTREKHCCSIMSCTYDTPTDVQTDTQPDIQTDGETYPQAEIMQTKLLGQHWFDHNELPTSIELSPYIAGESVICTQENGQAHVYIWHPDNRLQSLLGPLNGRFDSLGEWWNVQYGSHPRQVTVADNTGVALYDIRGHSSLHTDLFTLPHASLHPRERVMACTRYTTQPFYHIVATDYNVCLVDARFPNHTVLVWSHSLLSMPQYLNTIPNVLNDNTQDLLLVASQTIPEVMVYPIDMNIGTYLPPCADGAVWRASRMGDFAHLINRTEPLIYKPLIEKYLEVPIVGVSGVVHHQGGLSVLQLSSTGNLFCQDYHTSLDTNTDKTFNVGPGSCDLILDDTVLTKAADWLEDMLQGMQETLSYSMKTIDISDKLQDMLMDKLDPHVLCPLCGSMFSHQGDETSSHQMAVLSIDEPDATEQCYRCGNTLEYSRALHDVVTKEEVAHCPPTLDVCIPRHVTEFKLDPVEDDVTTKIVLALWEEEEVTDLVAKRDKMRTAELDENFAKWKAQKLKDRGEYNEEMEESEAMEAVPSEAEEDLITQMEIQNVDQIRKTSIPNTATDNLLQQTATRHRHLSTSSIDSLGFGSTPSRLKKTTKKISCAFQQDLASLATTQSPLLLGNRRPLTSPSDKDRNTMPPPKRKGRISQIMGF